MACDGGARAQDSGHWGGDEPLLGDGSQGFGDDSRDNGSPLAGGGACQLSEVGAQGSGDQLPIGGGQGFGGAETERPLIREVIVVEGKDDVAAVKRACRAETLTTSGLGISREIIEEIRLAQRCRGVVIFTDPDGPGARIRHMINQAVPGCKQAYLYRDRGRKNGPIGVEHAAPGEILAALAAAKATAGVETEAETFTLADLVVWELTGGPRAQAKRDWLSRRLQLGQTNAKQFLRRLQDYGVGRLEFLAACREMRAAFANAQGEGAAGAADRGLPYGGAIGE